MGTDTHVPNVARRNLWNILNVDAGIPPRFAPPAFHTLADIPQNIR